MTHLKGIGIVAIVASIGLAASQTPTGSPPERLHLKIELNDPFNPQFALETDVITGQPFKIDLSSRGVKTTISGVVTPSAGGRYKLPLYTSEWASEKNNVQGTTQLDLELGKTFSGGGFSGIIYGRSITLTRAE